MFGSEASAEGFAPECPMFPGVFRKILAAGRSDPDRVPAASRNRAETHTVRVGTARLRRRVQPRSRSPATQAWSPPRHPARLAALLTSVSDGALGSDEDSSAHPLVLRRVG